MDGSAFRGLGTAFAVLLIALFLVGATCGVIATKVAGKLPKINVTFEEKR